MREGRVKLAGVHACLASRWRRATQPHHPVKPAFTPRAQAPPHHRDLRNPCPSPDPARHPRPSPSPSPSPSRAAARVPHDRRLHQDRERFFAFAGADLLLETTADGRVAFAAGAFRTRLGREPDSLLGRPAATIVAAEDGAVFATCLALLAARGRIAPTALRLADAARTPAVLCGLSRPGLDGAPRLCLSFGAPAAPLPSASVCSSTLFGREAEQRLRAAAPSALDLLEVVSPRPDMPRAEIAAALLDQAGTGSVASELSPGRFGLLRGSEAAPLDLAALVAGLDAGLRARGLDARVGAAERVALDPAGTDEGGAARPAVRALRYALSAFARGGAPALAAAGFTGGLAGFVTAVTARTAMLRRILAERRFRLAFQPIVGLNDRAVHHYEALLRPDAGPGGVSRGPADLVTMAEMVGLAEDLDWAVFETAREAALRTGTAIAFNLSGLSVQSRAFRARLLAALDQAGSPRLLAEVTETAEIEDETAAAETIEALRARGIPICLDDFGAGAAAFRYLRRFQVDHVKIDGAYVRQAAENERDRGFVAAMVDLSLTVGAHAIAEQVETEAVAETMRGLGVRYGQGWLFGRPAELPTAATATARRRGAKEQWG
jgi:EAL domain-containing protein (putative c-di-GMP-specific phosphodiesterase class I)